MLKALVSYFWGNKEEDSLTLDEAYTILSNDKNEETERLEELPMEIVEKEGNYVCAQKMGNITNANGQNYLIDDTYTFQSEVDYPLSSKVLFIVSVNQQGETHVSNVKLLDDAWDDTHEKEVTWCMRSLVTKVCKREARKIFVSPGNMSIDLNSTASDFVPVTGDWLDIECKCVIDEDVSDLFGKVLEVVKIRPLRTQILEGNIREWNGSKGVINRSIAFSREALSSGYEPAVKDCVVTEVIESEQGLCTWRSLKVVHNFEGGPKSKLQLLKQTDELVVITKHIVLNAFTVGETLDFNVDITNRSSEDIQLLNVVCESRNIAAVRDLSESLIIPGNATVKELFSYKVLAGTSTRDLLVFKFPDFNIMRYVVAKFATTNGGHKAVKARHPMQDCIKGEPPMRSCRFVEVKLPEFQLPKRLYEFISENERSPADLITELSAMKPSLKLFLTFNIYEERFHTLLHLQEIHTLIHMQSYEQDKACFINDGEFLLLEIANLAERRPSLIVGDKILARDSLSKLVYEGFIHKVGGKHVYLKFAQMFHELYKNEDYSITAQQSRVAIRKMHQAISLAVKKLGREFLFPCKVTSKEPQVAFEYDKYDDSINSSHKKIKDRSEQSRKNCSQKRLLELLQQNHEAKRNAPNKLTKEDLQMRIKKCTDENKSKLQLQPTTHRRKTKTSEQLDSLKLKLEWFDKSLNYFQKEAVRNILLGEARPLPYIIFGPPGTGKTVTIIETILQLMRMLPHSRLLVAAPSNSSADLIASRLIALGVLKPGDLVRLVSYKLVQENNIPVHLVPYCGTVTMGREGTTQGPQILKNGLTLGCGSSVIGRHRITIGTCVTLGSLFSLGFPKGHFTHIIIDEAGQAMEPEIMIPLSFLDIAAGQAILAGDPMQLGPIIPSTLAVHFGLQESLLERLLNAFPYVRDLEGFPTTGGYDPRLVTRLVYNYRSLPETIEVSNKLFYHSELRATISPTDSEEAIFLENLREMLPSRECSKQPPAMVFHGVNGENYQTSDSPSWFNPDEASQIFDYLNSLYKLKVSHKDIGIITPYVKQVRYIRTILTEAEFELPKIGSVEDFQGQEYKVILLSIVRSSSSYLEGDFTYKLGFVSNPRRLNVALSRAQVLTVIVGNPHILMADPSWRTVFEYCRSIGSYCGCAISQFP